MRSDVLEDLAGSVAGKLSLKDRSGPRWLRIAGDVLLVAGLLVASSWLTRG
jgi:hypothetical protein